MAATATCPCVNTRPGAHTHTHTDPQSSIFAKIHADGRTGSETRASYTHTRRDTQTRQRQVPSRTRTCSHAPPSSVFPCLASQYCKRPGGSGRHRVARHTPGPRLLCCPTKGARHPRAEDLGFREAGADPRQPATHPRPGPSAPGLVWVIGWGPAPSGVTCHKARGLRSWQAAEGADGGRGGEQEQQQKNLVCTVRAFESLLLQYTLTKIESHFISIQQQQKKTSFLDC